MGIHQFLFLERTEGYGQAIMKNYDFDSKDCIWIFSHTGINAVNIDMALEAKKRGMKVIVYGSAGETGDKASRHSSGKNLFQLADIIVDSCVPLVDASVPLKNHFDKVGPLSTLSFVTMVWMTITTVAEILADRGVHLYIHPSHNVPGDTTAHERLDAAIAEYQKKVKIL
ncbi:MAG: sugar isomerase domain-containing protein [Bacteroides cellulosilyticus]